MAKPLAQGVRHGITFVRVVGILDQRTMSNAQAVAHDFDDARAGGLSEHRERTRFTDYLPFVFVLSLLLPYRFEIGPLLLSPSRLFLLLILFPSFIVLVSGKAGRLRAVDYLIFTYSLWMAAALLRAHGLNDGAEPAGVHLVEVMGSYLVARCYVRSAESFYAVIRLFLLSIMVMLPFAIAESLTGQHYLNKLFSVLGPTTFTPDIEPRMGFDRAFSVFEHPILHGIYGVSLFSLTYYVIGFGSRMITSAIRLGAVAGTTVTAMSSGPLLALVLQMLFMAWDHMTRAIKQRWWILAGMAGSVYLVVDFISNRTPFHVIVSYLAFNPYSAYNRILIWQYGTAEVARHPLFGIGISEWERPAWMSGSMDNFWLLLAVQGGLPAFSLFAGAVVALCIGLGRLKLVDPRLISYRRGWMIAILALAIGGATVHYWKTMLCLLVFLVGSAVWMLDERRRKESVQESQPVAARKQRPRSIQFG